MRVAAMLAWRSHSWIFAVVDEHVGRGGCLRDDGAPTRVFAVDTNLRGRVPPDGRTLDTIECTIAFAALPSVTGGPW
jgi:hypothetical protein